jgi:steroid 5-alpha reductase family enzyme
VGIADVAATVVVFAFSVATRNSSIYDPYWSVAPVPIALFWLWQPGSSGFADVRHDVIFALICLWAIRLTGNFVSQWRGLTHEDWRYQDIHKQSGIFYWPVSFLGIHLMPTVLVFLGCLSLWPALTGNASHMSWLDVVAALVTLGAIAIEAAADLQMRRFRNDPLSTEKAIPPGLWSLSRHPNYFGEVSFWWGLYLFALASQPGFWWTIVGPLAITLLFVGVSIPLMETHLQARHTHYQEYRRRVSPFIPWFSR